MKVIYIKTTENCNLNCKHCFVEHKNNKMNNSDFDKIIEKIKEFNDSEILFLWHGGEPTLIGEEFIKNNAKKLKNNFVNSRQEMQTNLLTYNSKWKEIYREYFNSHIGVSYDFDIRFYGKNKKLEDKFWKNFNQLKEDKITSNIIITVTKKVINNGANYLWEWINKKNIESLHLERLTKDGSAISFWEELGFNNKEYNDFMIDLSILYIEYIKDIKKKDIPQKIHISPFDSIMENIKKDQPFSCSYLCNNFYTFNPDGNIKGCTRNQKIIGNLSTSVSELIQKNTQSKKKCLECKFSHLCKSGCSILTEIFDETGECIGNYKLLQLLTKFSKIYNISYELNKTKIS